MPSMVMVSGRRRSWTASGRGLRVHVQNDAVRETNLTNFHVGNAIVLTWSPMYRLARSGTWTVNVDPSTVMLVIGRRSASRASRTVNTGLRRAPRRRRTPPRSDMRGGDGFGRPARSPGPHTWASPAPVLLPADQGWHGRSAEAWRARRYPETRLGRARCEGNGRRRPIPRRRRPLDRDGRAGRSNDQGAPFLVQHGDETLGGQFARRGEHGGTCFTSAVACARSGQESSRTVAPTPPWTCGDGRLSVERRRWHSRCSRRQRH